MIKNKVLALICAVSMIGAMFTTVVSAANPDVKLTLSVEKCDFTLDDNLDEDLEYEDYYGAPVYKLSMAVSGLAKKASVKENGTTVAYTGTLLASLGAFIDFDAEKFTYVKGESSFGGTFVPGKVKDADQLSITWYDTAAKKEDGVVGSMYLFANSGKEVTEEVSFELNDAKTYAYLQYWDGTSKDAVLDGVNDITTSANGLSFVNAKLNEVIAPTHEAAELDVKPEDNKDKKAEGEPYTQGFKVTVIPNDDAVTGVDFKLTTSEGKSKEYTGADAFQFPEIKGDATIVLGLNVKEIPATATVDAVFTPVVVVAE